MREMIAARCTERLQQELDSKLECEEKSANMGVTDINTILP